ncbi:unnamed protein product [Zymoseptoria tritici ST99CH_3D1]|nr:unnamed protein product [Zymoseptoria tritici ST99CH_3D1]
MPPTTHHLSPRDQHLYPRKDGYEYDISPLAIVTIVIVVAGFLVLVGFAIGNFFFKSDRNSEQTYVNGSETMTQPQYQRWLRIRTKEDLMRRPDLRAPTKPVVHYTSSSMSSY